MSKLFILDSTFSFIIERRKEHLASVCITAFYAVKDNLSNAHALWGANG